MRNFILIVVLFNAAFTSLLFAGVEIHYNADETPDSSTWGGVFSAEVIPNANWGCSGGILTINTTSERPAWFGYHEYYDTPDWDLGDVSQGNYVSVRTRLHESSGEWSTYMLDGTFTVGILLLENEIHFQKDTHGEYGIYPLDVTEYHTYSILLKRGLVRYKVDDLTIYSGKAAEFPFTKHIVIGDGSGSSISGYGSMDIDEVTIITDPNMYIEFPMSVSVEIAPWARICQGESADLNLSVVGGYPPYTYQWQEYDDPNWINLGTDVTQTVSPTNTAEYRAIVTDSNDDSIVSEIYTLPVCQPTPDLNSNGCIDLEDFAILSREWLVGCE